MSVELDIEELASRSVAVVVSYYHFARTWKDWASIVLKIRSLSEELDASEVAFESIEPLILARLSERFDRETADLLSLEFADLFAAIAAPGPAVVGHG